jgi:hypothetical protein
MLKKEYWFEILESRYRNATWRSQTGTPTLDRIYLY